jgi:hypothetical protein
MRAGSLLASTDGAFANREVAASSLLALTQLGQAELAVALLADLWVSNRTPLPNRVSHETAVLVINAALTSRGKPLNAPLIAAEVLCRQAKKLDLCRSLHWPNAIDGRWLPGLGPKTKLLLIEALVEMALNTEPSPNALRSLAVRLYGIWDGDTDIYVRGGLA